MIKRFKLCKWILNLLILGKGLSRNRKRSTIWQLYCWLQLLLSSSAIYQGRAIDLKVIFSSIYILYLPFIYFYKKSHFSSLIFNLHTVKLCLQFFSKINLLFDFKEFVLILYWFWIIRILTSAYEAIQMSKILECREKYMDAVELGFLFPLAITQYLLVRSYYNNFKYLYSFAIRNNNN